MLESKNSQKWHGLEWLKLVNYRQQDRQSTQARQSTEPVGKGQHIASGDISLCYVRIHRGYLSFLVADKLCRWRDMEMVWNSEDMSKNPTASLRRYDRRSFSKKCGGSTKTLQELGISFREVVKEPDFLIRKLAIGLSTTATCMSRGTL